MIKKISNRSLNWISGGAQKFGKSHFDSNIPVMKPISIIDDVEEDNQHKD